MTNTKTQLWSPLLQDLKRTWRNTCTANLLMLALHCITCGFFHCPGRNRMQSQGFHFPMSSLTSLWLEEEAELWSVSHFLAGVFVFVINSFMRRKRSTSCWEGRWDHWFVYIVLFYLYCVDAGRQREKERGVTQVWSRLEASQTVC